ncbi:MAG: HD-GYP domain-containing protein, partial [Planctomycetota bacterium]
LAPFARSACELARYANAAILHDVGTALVPRDARAGGARRADDRRATLRLHPELGAEALRRDPDVDPLVLEAAYCHHMLDGGFGFPETTLAIRPGPVTQVVQVADLLETLTTRRAFRKGLGVDEAVAALLAIPGMTSRRTVLGLLLARLTPYPPGAKAVLGTGEEAVVVETFFDEPSRPRVRIFSDPEGRELPEPIECDLRALRDGASGGRGAIAEVILKPHAAPAVGPGPASQPSLLTA